MGAALAGLAAIAVLTAGCGGAPVLNGPSASTGSAAAFRANVAFAHCMQTHGVPNFPVPTSTGQSFQVSGNPGGGTPNTPSGRAYANCKGLLPQSSTSTGSGVTQAELDQTLKIVQCLRAHGEPDIPDPTVVNGNLNIAASPSVVQSSQFQAAATACRSLLPKGVHLP